MSFDVRTEGIGDLVAALKAGPERLDKGMRKEFRGITKTVEREARSRAQGQRPTPKTPKHAGEYHWSTLVNTIKAGADGDSPTVSFGSAKVPGWAGWEFGATKLPQFPPRSAKVGRGNAGYFFFPTVRDQEEAVLDAAQKVVDEYAKDIQ